jgi:hypothetical protein
LEEEEGEKTKKKILKPMHFLHPQTLKNSCKAAQD